MTKDRLKRKKSSRPSRQRFKRKKCFIYRSTIQRNLENNENSNKKRENTSISENQVSMSIVSWLLTKGISYFLWVPKFIYVGILSFLQLFLQTKNVLATDLEELKQRLKALEDKIEGISFQQSSSQNASSKVSIATGNYCRCSMGPTISGVNVIAPPPPPPPPPLPLAPVASHIPTAVSTRKEKLDFNKKIIPKTPALHPITLEDLKRVKLRKTKSKILCNSPVTKNCFTNEEDLKLLRIRGVQCYANHTTNKENFSLNSLSLSPSAKNTNLRHILRSTNQPKSPGGTPLLKNVRPKKSLKTPPAIQAARRLMTAET